MCVAKGAIVMALLVFRTCANRRSNAKVMRAPSTVFLSMALALLLVCASTASAYVVTNTFDSGPGSFRQAISDLNFFGVPSTIDVLTSGVVNLLSPLPSMFTTVDILAPNGFVLDGNLLSSGHGLDFASLDPGTSYLNGMQIRGFPDVGLVLDAFVSGAKVNVSNVEVYDNGGTGVWMRDGPHPHELLLSNIYENPLGVVSDGDSQLITDSNIFDNGIGVIAQGDLMDVFDSYIVNNSNAGIVLNEANDTLVQFNTIAFNGFNGVIIGPGLQNQILNNEIYQNVGLAIAAGQAIAMDAPILIGFILSGDNVVVNGFTSEPGRLQFFVACCNDEHGGASMDDADFAAPGGWFQHTFDRTGLFAGEALVGGPTIFEIQLDDRISATLTDLAGPKNTSEYSVSTTGLFAGDFDLDGDVDGRDFLYWQRGKGGTGVLFTDGNADGNSSVDGADLDVWKGNFGLAATSPLESRQAVEVPEPLTAYLAVVLLVLRTCFKPLHRGALV